MNSPLPVTVGPVHSSIRLWVMKAMAPMLTGGRLVQRLGLLCWSCLAWVGVGTASAQSPPPTGAPEKPPLLTMDQAVLWALQHNPDLASLRQQHGIAAAGIVIANTYPFNPIWE